MPNSQEIKGGRGKMLERYEKARKSRNPLKQFQGMRSFTEHFTIHKHRYHGLTYITNMLAIVNVLEKYEPEDTFILKVNDLYKLTKPRVSVKELEYLDTKSLLDYNFDGKLVGLFERLSGYKKAYIDRKDLMATLYREDGKVIGIILGIRRQTK